MRAVRPRLTHAQSAHVCELSCPMAWRWRERTSLRCARGGFSRAIACQKWHLEAVAQRAPLWPPTTLSPPTTTAIPSPTPTLPQRRAQDRAAALFVLATLKGYYINFYPALLHCDADRYIETWALVRCPGPRSDPGTAAGGHAADAGGTHLPLRGLVLHLLPDIDIGHAFFRYELHAGHDGGRGAAGRLRGSADGYPCGFLLQSGGCSEASLVGRL